MENKESKSDLSNLKNELQFVNEFDVHVHEVIYIINELEKMNLKQIKEWKEHLLTNYTLTNLDKITLKLIDRYCLNDAFIKMVLENQCIDYNIGDTVWFENESMRKECGYPVYEVISFEPYFLNSKKLNEFLKVNLKNIKTGYLTSYLTTHLEKCKN